MVEYDAADVTWKTGELTFRVLVTEDGGWFDWSDTDGWVLNEEKTAEILRDSSR